MKQNTYELRLHRSFSKGHERLLLVFRVFLHILSLKRSNHDPGLKPLETIYNKILAV